MEVNLCKNVCVVCNVVNSDYFISCAKLAFRFPPSTSYVSVGKTGNI